MADRQPLAGVAEQHLLMGDQPGQPHRMDRNPGCRRPAGAGHQLDALGGAPLLGGGSRHQGGGGQSGAGRGVGFAVVVQLDDLGGGEVGSGDLGEPHHHHRPDREVGDHQAVGRSLSPRRAQHLEGSGVEAGRADHGVEPEPPPRGEVVHHDVGPGELDDHVGACSRLGVGRHGDTARLATGRHVVGGDELHVGCPSHRRADEAAHASPRPGHGDPDHATYGSSSPGSNGPTAPITYGPA